VRTGVDGVHNIGKLVSFQGKQKIDVWETEECDAIRGSDGTLFHPGIERNETLHIYNQQLCQSLPLVYQQDVDHHGVETYRFAPASNVFGTPAENPRNQCFCKDDLCPPSGLFNVSACQHGSPIMLSWPHFYDADPTLVEAVDGLNPTKDKHQFQLDLVPKMGISMRASVRSQVNLMMTPQAHIKQLNGVTDIVYPIFWFETGVEELPEDMLSLVQMAVHAPERARSILYPILFAVGALLILAVLAYIVKRSLTSRPQEDEKDGLEGGHGGQQPHDQPQPRTPPPDYNDTV
jgi:scavenger receptor class B protein 1